MLSISVEPLFYVFMFLGGPIHMCQTVELANSSVDEVLGHGGLENSCPECAVIVQ